MTLEQHLARIQAGVAATAHHVEFGVALLLAAMAVWLVVEAVLLMRVPHSAGASAGSIRGT